MLSYCACFVVIRFSLTAVFSVCSIFFRTTSGSGSPMYNWCWVFEIRSYFLSYHRVLYRILLQSERPWGSRRSGRPQTQKSIYAKHPLRSSRRRQRTIQRSRSNWLICRLQRRWLSKAVTEGRNKKAKMFGLRKSANSRKFQYHSSL